MPIGNPQEQAAPLQFAIKQRANTLMETLEEEEVVKVIKENLKVLEIFFLDIAGSIQIPTVNFLSESFIQKIDSLVKNSHILSDDNVLERIAALFYFAEVNDVSDKEELGGEEMTWIEGKKEEFIAFIHQKFGEDSSISLFDCFSDGGKTEQVVVEEVEEEQEEDEGKFKNLIRV